MVFHRQAKCFKLNLFIRKSFSRRSKLAGKIGLAANQFARCPALKETHVLFLLHHLCLSGKGCYFYTALEAHFLN